jgi:hypothetical protein
VASEQSSVVAEVDILTPARLTSAADVTSLSAERTTTVLQATSAPDTATMANTGSPSSSDEAQSPDSPKTGQPAHVARDLILGVILFLALESALFRSGYYSKLLAPESYAGRVHHFVEWTANHPARGQREVALFGDSRVAEGFSAKIADEVYDGEGIRFLNFGTPGASLRVQYYLLREVDPHANRFDKIAIGLDNYDDLSTSEDLSDRAMDLRFVTELLRYEDVVDFPPSFTSSRGQNDAAATCLLKGHGYKLDLQDFLGSPRKRLETVDSLSDSDFDWAYEYSGRPESLAGVAFDGMRLTFPPSATQEAVADLQGRLNETRRQPFPNGPYRREWLGRIVDRYRDSSTRLIIFQMPRGPFVWKPPHRADTVTVDSLRTVRNVIVIDQNRFSSFERPSLFRDSLHLNQDGREAFSKQCAALIVRSSDGNANGVDHPPTAQSSLWRESEPGNYEAVLEPAAPHLPLADGFYERGAGVNYVKPEFWLTLPPARGAGLVKVTGYMHPLLKRLLPLTVTAEPAAGETVKSVIAKDGWFEFQVSCPAPADLAKSDRVQFTIDKCMAPKAAGIGNDERPLSIGIVKIEFLATSPNSKH